MAGEIEKSVEFLEALFQKSESDLNHIERKLEFEFQQDGFSKEENPVKLMKRVAAIKQEFHEVVEETKKLQDAQKEMTETFREQLSVLMQLTAHVDTTIHNPKREPSVEVQALEQLLGVPICPHINEPEPKPADPVKETPQDPETEVKPVNKSKKNPKKATTEIDMEEFLSDVEAIDQSPASRREDTDEFIPLSPDEFEKVSTLVRRYVKLGDVNTCYRLLWQHFKVEKNTQALSPKEMYNMGLRVSGASGEAKLKILRSLKLLHLSAKGNAKLL